MFAVILAFSAPRRAVAYRPFVSTDAAVAGVGEAEVELGYAGFTEHGGDFTIVAPTVVANLGIARGLELVGESELANDLYRESGRDRVRFEDTAVSLKWVVLDGVLQDEGAGPSVAMELSAILPTLRGEDRPGGELVGILSGRAVGCTYHLNAGALVEAGDDEPGVLWGVIVERAIRGPLRAVAELNGESIRGSRPDNSALVGAVWSVQAPAPLYELSFDVGVRRGLSSAADDWGGTAGITFAFPWAQTTSEEARR